MNAYVLKIYNMMISIKSTTFSTSNRIQYICKDLLELKTLYNRYPPTEYESNTLFNTYKEQLCCIANFINGNPPQKVMSHIISSTELVEEVFEKVFKYSTHIKLLEEYVNSIFAEFIKGITRFEKDEFSNKELKARTNYIEHLIYYKLFSKYHHGNEEISTKYKQAFESCFPNTKIDITLSWSLDAASLPTRLEIETVGPNEVISEFYEKDLKSYDIEKFSCNIVENLDPQRARDIYEDPVHCWNIVYNHETKVQICKEKDQTFYNPMNAWIIGKRRQGNE